MVNGKLWWRCGLPQDTRFVSALFDALCSAHDMLVLDHADSMLFVGNLFVEQDESTKSRVQSKNWFRALHSTHFCHCENSSLETLPLVPH